MQKIEGTAPNLQIMTADGWRYIKFFYCPLPETTRETKERLLLAEPEEPITDSFEFLRMTGD